MERVSAKKVLVTTFLVDVLDIVLNLVVAIVTGSVVMFAEMLQGVADLTSAGFLLIGLKRSSQPPDRTHPFGYGREMYFWTLLASLLMLVVTSGLSFYFGFQRFLEPEPIRNIFLAYIALTIAFVSNIYGFSLSFKRLLKGQKSSKILSRFFKSSRVETKTALILDLMGTGSASLGLVSLLLYNLTGNYRYDGLGAMMIGISLGFLSIFLVINIKDFLIGKSASIGTQEKIIRVTKEIREVRDVLDLKTIYVGPGDLLVNLEVHLEDNLTTDEIEKLIDKIKERIQKEIPYIQHIQVELETP